MIEKYNPLFVDSTKFRGDMIRSNFELKNILIYDDETLFVLVTDRNGTQEARLKWVDAQKFEGGLHLPHQAIISFQFIIRKGEDQTFQSRIFEGQAQYALSAEWEPVLEDPCISMVAATASEKSVSTTEPSPKESGNDPSNAVSGEPEDWSPRKSVVAVHSLIEKWGF